MLDGNPQIGREDEAVRSLQVGERIRTLRNGRRMSLRQLADASQTTASFISQLERGLSGANTSTLMRICKALGIGISELFQTDEPGVSRVLTRALRPALPIAEHYRKTLLSRRPIQAFEVYAGQFGPGGSTGERPYTHGNGHEMLLVLRGDIELTLGEDVHLMSEGDSIEYATSTPHKTRNVGTDDAEVLWIISPPTSAASELDQYSPGKTLAAGSGHPGE